MNVSVEIHYISNGNKVLQSGSFPARGRKPEQVAMDFWRQIQRSMPYGAELEKIFVDGEEIKEPPLDEE